MRRPSPSSRPLSSSRTQDTSRRSSPRCCHCALLPSLTLVSRTAKSRVVSCSAPISERNVMKTRVGIDAIGVAVPRRYIDIADLAVARGVDPAKYTNGPSAREMAVAEPGEDTVALAAQAARRALAAAKIDRRNLGMLVVGTETGVDHSKP